MTIRDMKGTVDDKILVNNVLVSVYNKDGLDVLVPGLLEINPDVRFISTGGTYDIIQKLLGEDAEKHLVDVEAYTGAPEMEGGLVKTLHPAIHGGLLGERDNEEHQQYLQLWGKRLEFLNKNVDGIEDTEVGGIYKVKVVEGVEVGFIDMVVVDLYPFQDVIESEDFTIEKARGHIDIGGPAMLRAAAKNFPSCVTVCRKFQYRRLLKHLRENNGCTTLDMRADLADYVFTTTAFYDSVVSRFFRARETFSEYYLDKGGE